jgi:hypothetical protein
LPRPHANSGSSSLSRISNHIAEIESEAEVQDREDADALNEIIMAIDMRDRGTLGCAYYIAREEKLFLMEDIKLSGLDIVDTLKLHASPTVVLISTKSDDALEDHLMKEAKDASRSDNPGMLALTSLNLTIRAVISMLITVRCHLRCICSRFKAVGRIPIRICEEQAGELGPQRQQWPTHAVLHAGRRTHGKHGIYTRLRRL